MNSFEIETPKSQMKIGKKKYRKYDKICPCLACGEVGTTDKYRTKNPHCVLREMFNWPENWIERACSNCGYQWFELPLNHKK